MARHLHVNGVLLPADSGMPFACKWLCADRPIDAHHLHVNVVLITGTPLACKWHVICMQIAFN